MLWLVGIKILSVLQPSGSCYCNTTNYYSYRVIVCTLYNIFVVMYIIIVIIMIIPTIDIDAVNNTL